MAEYMGEAHQGDASPSLRDMVNAGVMNEDGSHRHSCPWCCESFGFVMDGAWHSYRAIREHVESRPWWWRWLHPLKRARLLGEWDGLATVLDDAGK